MSKDWRPLMQLNIGAIIKSCDDYITTLPKNLIQVKTKSS